MNFSPENVAGYNRPEEIIRVFNMREETHCKLVVVTTYVEQYTSSRISAPSIDYESTYQA